MKIGLLHLDLDQGPQKTNLEKLLVVMKEAISCGAQWIITPEVALQGYHMTQTGAPFQIASEENGCLKPFQELARDNKITIFLGAAFTEAKESHTVDDDSRAEPAAFNSLLVIDGEGRLLHRHNKVWTVNYKTERWSTPGTDFTAITIDGARIGLFVCADAYFEAFGHIYKNQDVQLLITVAAWPRKGCGKPASEAWIATSKEANAPMVVSNQTGHRMMDLREADSAIVWNGEVFSAHSDAEALLLFDYDAENQRFTPFEVFPLPLD